MDQVASSPNRTPEEAENQHRQEQNIPSLPLARGNVEQPVARMPPKNSDDYESRRLEMWNQVRTIPPETEQREALAAWLSMAIFCSNRLTSLEAALQRIQSFQREYSNSNSDT